MSAPSLSSIPLPPWAVALALAAGAPFFARLVTERWIGARRAATEAMLSRARGTTEPGRVAASSASAAPSAGPSLGPEGGA